MSMHSLSLSMFSMLIWKWMTGRNTPKGNYGKGNGMINSMVHLFVPDLLLQILSNPSKQQGEAQQPASIALLCIISFEKLLTYIFLQNATQSLRYIQSLYQLLHQLIQNPMHTRQQLKQVCLPLPPIVWGCVSHLCLCPFLTIQSCFLSECYHWRSWSEW